LLFRFETYFTLFGGGVELLAGLSRILIRKVNMLKRMFIPGLLVFFISVVACDTKENKSSDLPVLPPMDENVKIVLLHHSTGGVIWSGGVAGWISAYNTAHETNYQITETAFPKSSPYGWNNYPYDYWNIWVNHAGTTEYMEEPTLEILTSQYHVIIFKHCYPVSDIVEDSGTADITSASRQIQNYKLQYNALKQKMLTFPDNRFIVWTGAARKQSDTNEANATRAQQFFDWVKDEWDADGDNIFVWDFWQLETEGGLYLTDDNASGDSHPNSTFAAETAPLLGQRIVNVIEGRGDTTSLTGK